MKTPAPQRNPCREGKPTMMTMHLRPDDLSARWHIATRTLDNWRWKGEGPRYLKIGGRVVYRLEDVEAYEAGQLRLTDPESGT